MNKIFKVIKDMMKILKKIYFKMLLYLIEIQYFFIFENLSIELTGLKITVLLQESYLFTLVI
jgi:uncharacterized phage-like protein YoqJ